MVSLEELLAAGTQPSSSAMADVLRRLDAIDPPRSAATLTDVPFAADLPLTAPGLWAVISEFGGSLVNCGAWGVSEAQAPAANQCLYLCLAASVLPAGAPYVATASSFRRHIEAAVLAAHPQWLDPMGPEAGAFADFLVQGLPAVPQLRSQPLAAYDSAERTCEIFRSPIWYNPAAAVIGLWHAHGHYQWLRWGLPAPGPSLAALLAARASPHEGSPRVPTLVVDAGA